MAENKKELAVKLPAARFFPQSVPEEWDEIEIEAIHEDPETGDCIPVHKDEMPISYYSVYLHDVLGGTMCIADLPEEPEAIIFAELIKAAAKNYKP